MNPGESLFTFFPQPNPHTFPIYAHIYSPFFITSLFLSQTIAPMSLNIFPFMFLYHSLPPPHSYGFDWLKSIWMHQKCNNFKNLTNCEVNILNEILTASFIQISSYKESVKVNVFHIFRYRIEYSSIIIVCLVVFIFFCSICYIFKC